MALDAAKEECQASYDSLNRSLDATMFGKHSYFLNYGYVPDESPQYAAVTLPEYCLNKNSVRLVLETIGDCDLHGKRVLDVGCGRGGTVAVLLEYFRPAFVNAVDLSAAAIAFCRQTHTHPRVRFDQGDAERLPFDDGVFDVVTNVESSSCYPNPGAFYAEVWRVLRPGGAFLYTDCLPVETMEWCARQLPSCGFVVVRDRDITRNVMRSCDEIARARIDSFDEGRRDERLANFLGAPGSANYEHMRAGRWSYRILTLRKPATGRLP